MDGPTKVGADALNRALTLLIYYCVRLITRFGFYCMKTAIKSQLRGRFFLLAFPLLVSAGFGQDTTEKPKSLPAAIMRKYDVDQDGLLSDSEKAAWKADVQRGRADAQAKRLEKYDANRDGKLDKVEKAEASKPAAAKPAAAKPRSG